ncbi:MAG TPA: response regulator [Stellaceae bacterium]|jgi:two-component system phosphate regulon response regulator OmpR|nr:response regulator [Stellaceae bacterium]
MTGTGGTVATPSAGPAEQSHLLLVDDDARLRAVLRRYLERNQFRITEAASAAEARKRLGSFAFDLVVLDVMMPGESGLDMLADLRRTNAVPVLMLTAMAETRDRINGLERGADDYLAKPFEPRELLLRIRSILMRVTAAQPPKPLPQKPDPAIRLGACRFDPVRQELTRDGVVQHLTSAETALLAVLAAKPGEPLSRDALNAQGIAAGNERTIDVQITRLRRKIEDDPKFPRYLQTVRGIGYVLKPD